MSVLTAGIEQQVSDFQVRMALRLSGLKNYGNFLQTEIAKVKKMVTAGEETHVPTVGMAWAAAEPHEGGFYPERSVNRLRALKDYQGIWKRLSPIYVKAGKHIAKQHWGEALRVFESGIPIANESQAPLQMLQSDMMALAFLIDSIEEWQKQQ